MIINTQYVTIDNQLRFLLFGLECTLNIEFDPSIVEKIFSDATDGMVNEKRYVLWDKLRLKITAIAEAYEPGDVLLMVESAKAFSPPLPTIVERAKFQVYRLERAAE